jgi:hypothetical protein
MISSLYIEKMLHDIVVAMGRANVILLYFLGFFSKIVDKLDNEERQMMKLACKSNEG